MSETKNRTVRIVNRQSGEVLLGSARWCQDSLCKLIGYQFRSHIKPDEALVLVHKKDSITQSAIHMFFVFTPLGVIWVNKQNCVTHLQVAKPWRPHYASPSPACYVIETNVENLERFKIGDFIEFKSLTGPEFR